MTFILRRRTDTGTEVPDTMHGANCHNTTGLFDSQRPDEDQDTWQARYRQARRLCDTCPVYAACELSVAYGPRGLTGIWAGRDQRTEPHHDRRRPRTIRRNTFGY